MKTHYDHESDALNVRFGDAQIRESAEVSPGIVLDFGEDGRLIAIKVLDASRTLIAGGVPLPAA